MDILQFKPTVYRVEFEGFHGISTWDLLTLDGYTPDSTVYFMIKGDHPSSSEVDIILQAINNEDFKIIELDTETFNKDIWEIDIDSFETAGEAYSNILQHLL